MMRFMHTARALTLSTLLLAPGASAATPDDPSAGDTPQARAAALAAKCKLVPCRTQARDIDLRMDAENSFHFRSQLIPYIDTDGLIILYPGDTIIVSLTKDGEKLSLPKIVRAENPSGPVDLGSFANSDAAPETTISFALSQDEGKPDMTLVATNHTKMAIKYTAVMGVPAQQGLQPSRTSICTLLPAKVPEGFAGHETWPHAIGMLLLSDFRIEPDDGKMNCD